MNVVFPMNINYSSVFNELHKRAMQWHSNVDFQEVAQREVQRMKTSSRPQLPILRKHNTGHVINIRA